eukprot:TRINITY_DN3319_c0_g1_i2.p1 TRINITY_DN3319_c0_g1~~TRINITY_DN3319_c0_g1_i2.p1  ORF type:complete len:193 (-),score=25.03 TRINITY_DN3319_c0_g1_i2:98-676(-)
MFLVDLFWWVLSPFRTWFTKSGNILLVGLDNAGKTTLLYKLKSDTLKSHPPTMLPNSEDIYIGSVQLKAFDLGGHAMGRKVWKDYFPSVAGIVFLVDAADTERFQESKRELDGLLHNPDLATLPILVLGTKIDVVRAVSEAELRLHLGLTQTTGRLPGTVLPPGVRPLEVFMISSARSAGYTVALNWLVQYI